MTFITSAGLQTKIRGENVDKTQKFSNRIFSKRSKLNTVMNVTVQKCS
jgi:hypothetical protein